MNIHDCKTLIPATKVNHAGVKQYVKKDHDESHCFHIKQNAYLLKYLYF